MKLFTLFFLFVTFVASADSFQDIQDSVLYYQQQRNFPTALEWSKKAYKYSKSNFERTDTNNLNVLKNLAALCFYNSKFDSAIHYQKIHLDIAEETLNELDERLSESMNNLAVFYQFSGNNEGAEKYFVKSLDKTRQIYRDDHPNLAKSIGNVAVFFKRVGKTEEAESLYLESVEMSRRIYKEPHSELAKSLNNIAAFYIEISEYDLAEKYILESYEIYKELFDENDDRLAMVLNNIGAFYSLISKYSDAEVFLNRALEIRRNFYEGDHHNLALSILQLGEVYLELNKIKMAGSLIEESVEMFERIYKDKNEFVASSYSAYATYLFKIGDYTASEDYISNVIVIYEKKYSAKYELIAVAYNSKAFFFEQRGYYKDAIINYQKAFDEINKATIVRKSFAVTVLNNLGKMYRLINDTRQSIKYYEEALTLAEEIYDGDHLEFVRIYNNIADYYVRHNRFSMAEEYLSEAMAMQDRMYNETNLHKISSLMTYAYLYKQKGDYALSEKYYTDALEEIEQFLPEGINTKFRIKQNLNSLYLRTNRNELAEKSILESYNDFPKYFPKTNTGYLQVMNQVMYLYISMDEPEKVYPYLKESLDISYKSINDFFLVLSDFERSNFYKLFKVNFDLNNNFVINHYENNPEYAGFLLNKQINTKGILLSTTTKLKNEISASSDANLIITFNKWRDAKEHIAKLYLKSKTELEASNIDIDSIADYANSLEKELSEKSNSFENIKPIQQIDYKDIQIKLNDNEAAVEIMKISEKNMMGELVDIHYAALILKKNSIYPELIVMDNGNELEASYLKIYKNELRNDNEDKKSYGYYWGKIAEELSGIEKVYVSPDGIYNQINLNTLKNPDTEKYLFEEIDITILTNIRGIIDLKETKEIVENTEFVFFGNPDFKYRFGKEPKEIYVKTSSYNILDSASRGGLDLYPLSYTEEEISKITDIIKEKNYNHVTFMDTSATEEQLKKIKQPKVLHLSTHGYFLKDVNDNEMLGYDFDISRFNENPLLKSMLFFTGSANTLNDSLFNRKEDGILTALEAQNLDLRNTELAVMAACETGLGEIISGEGVYGFQRAFIQAGAKSIIMSLWKANDKATKELMINFYNEWLSGKPKRVAFETAQNIVRKKFRYPYFWGAFIMIGE